MEQNSEEWYQARRGKLTASILRDAVARQENAKDKYYSTRSTIMDRLRLERKGVFFENFQSWAIRHGAETEDDARYYYENETFSIVEQVGFIEHPTIPNFGASPDGLVGKKGLIEIKCPTQFVHDKRLIKEAKGIDWVDNVYYYQMQAQMMCTEREWCDFVSFDNRFPENEQMIIKRVNRDEKLIKYITDEVIKFNEELDELIEIFKR